QRLFHLVDPQHARRDRLRQVQRAAGALLRFTDQAAKQRADVQPQQGHAPQPADHLGRQALARAGDPQQGDSLGMGSPYSRARSEKARSRRRSQSFSTFSPPTLSIVSVKGKNSSAWLSRMICFFSLVIRSMSVSSSMPSRTMALANT